MNYTSFLFETYGNVKSESAKRDLIMTLVRKDSNISLQEKTFFEVCIENGFLNEFVKAMETGDYTNLNESLALNEESLKDKFMKKFKEVKQKVADGGKAALNKLSDTGQAILKVGANILSPFQAIMKKIADLVKKAWEKGKAAAQALAGKVKDKIEPYIKKIVKDGDKKKSLTGELASMKQIAGYGTQWITGKFTESMAKSGEAAAKEDESRNYGGYMEYAGIMAIREMLEEGASADYIIKELTTSLTSLEEAETVLEGGGHGDQGGLHIPFLSSLMKKIGHTPPFSYFHKLGDKAAAAANNKLEKFSGMISSLGGPGPFKYLVLGGIFGAVVGYFSESGAKTLVFGTLEIASKLIGVAIPGVGILYSIIKYTGMALLVYGIAEQIAGAGEKEKGEEKKEDGGEKKSEEKESK